LRRSLVDCRSIGILYETLLEAMCKPLMIARGAAISEALFAYIAQALCLSYNCRSGDGGGWDRLVGVSFLGYLGEVRRVFLLQIITFQRERIDCQR